MTRRCPPRLYRSHFKLGRKKKKICFSKSFSFLFSKNFILRLNVWVYFLQINWICIWFSEIEASYFQEIFFYNFLFFTKFKVYLMSSSNNGSWSPTDCVSSSVCSSSTKFLLRLILVLFFAAISTLMSNETSSHFNPCKVLSNLSFKYFGLLLLPKCLHWSPCKYSCWTKLKGSSIFIFNIQFKTLQWCNFFFVAKAHCTSAHGRNYRCTWSNWFFSFEP